jgi:hypothetical protein
MKSVAASAPVITTAAIQTVAENTQLVAEFCLDAPAGAETLALTSSGSRSVDDPLPASSQIWRRTSTNWRTIARHSPAVAYINSRIVAHARATASTAASSSAPRQHVAAAQRNRPWSNSAHQEI